MFPEKKRGSFVEKECEIEQVSLGLRVSVVGLASGLCEEPI